MCNYLFSRAFDDALQCLAYFPLGTDWDLNGTRQSDQVTQYYSMFTFSRYRCLITLITIQATCVNFAHSYEQGSYLVFNIIESAELEPTKGGIAIPAEALAKAETQPVVSEQSERSEFEIDFKQAIQPETIDSAF